MSGKICSICKQSKDLTEFGNNKKNYDKKQKYCRLCASIKDKKANAKPTRKAKLKENREAARFRNKVLLWLYLADHPCVDCGESDLLKLQFDHVKGNKVMAVTEAAKNGWSVKRLESEINKCVVRCAGCHAVKTAKENGSASMMQRAISLTCSLFGGKKPTKERFLEAIDSESGWLRVKRFSEGKLGIISNGQTNWTLNDKAIAAILSERIPHV